MEKTKFKPVPKGEYLARMNRYSVVQTKKGDAMVKASFQIVNGDHKDRLVFENYILTNASQMAVKVAKEKLSKYIKAAGGSTAFEDDPSVLDKYLETPVLLELDIEENGQYGDRNTIKKYKAR